MKIPISNIQTERWSEKSEKSFTGKKHHSNEKSLIKSVEMTL